METITGKLSQMRPLKRTLVLVGMVLLVYAVTAPLDILNIPRVGPMLRGVAGAAAAVVAFRATSPEWREQNDPRAKWPLPGRRWGLIAILFVWLAFVVFSGSSFPSAVTETANATVILLLFVLALRGPTDPAPDVEPAASWEWRNPLKTIRPDSEEGEDEGAEDGSGRVRGLFRPRSSRSSRTEQRSSGVSDLDQVVALSAEDPETAARIVAGDADLATALTAAYPELAVALETVWRAETEGEPGFDDDEFYTIEDNADNADNTDDADVLGEDDLSEDLALGDLGDDVLDVDEDDLDVEVIEERRGA